MGLLTIGAPLHWDEIKEHSRYMQKEGIRQFIYLYKMLNSRMKHTLKWGDEIEYTLLRIDPASKDVQLLRMASELLKKLPSEDLCGNQFIWQPEYAEYMVEGIPGIPFGRLLHAFSSVEPNMCKRRRQLMACLPEHCIALTLTAFPRLGCPDFAYPPAVPTPKNGISKSLFFPDAVINQGHPRFSMLTQNIRARRGTKVASNVPIFRDTNTPNPFVEDFSALHDGSDPDAASAALPDHVYVDAMGFGMGLSCLQITFQSCCIGEARILYDQLATLCPILMALSAATPAIRGYLLDTDCRWGIISDSVDDRTEEERGLKPLDKNRFVIPKSRYDSISSFLSLMGETYNDIPLVYDPEFYATLLDEGVDEPLAKHVAHLFIREPITAFAGRIKVPENEEFVEHFENIQSTNWQSMRFKPPPLNSNIGWRVEFRPVELQLTDFENAAFVTFILLLSRTILSLKLNLLIPISKVDENIRTAIKRDAVSTGQFYFRQGHLLTTDGTPIELAMACSKFRRNRTYSSHVHPSAQNGTTTEQQHHQMDNPTTPVHSCTSKCLKDHSKDVRAVEPEQTYRLMSVNEIMNGSTIFPGLIPLVRHYVHTIGGDPVVVSMVHRYMDLLSQRASGQLMTTASWMRSRIRAHPDYRQDSYISRSVNSDLMRECCAITCGGLRPSELLPPASLSSSMERCCSLDVNCRQWLRTSTNKEVNLAEEPNSVTSSTEPKSVAQPCSGEGCY